MFSDGLQWIFTERSIAGGQTIAVRFKFHTDHNINMADLRNFEVKMTPAKFCGENDTGREVLYGNTCWNHMQVFQCIIFTAQTSTDHV